MKKLLLLFACSGIVWATAQNNTNVNLQHNHSKQGVREMAVQKNPLFKRQQERIKIAKTKASHLNKSFDRSSCFSYYTDNAGYTNIAGNYNAPDSIVSWLWSYGDGYTDSTSSYDTWHYYYQPNGSTVSYSLCLTTTNNHGVMQSCCDSITVVNTLSNCSADFFFSVDSLNGAVFTDLSSSDSTIVSRVWDFGDGTSSTLANPVHQYAQSGTYNVCLTINSSNGCSNTYCYPVNVNDYSHSCSASFYYTSLSSSSFSFTDQSSTSNGNVVSYLWNFGDGASASAQNPSHTYSLAGTYTICLTINTDLGCSSNWCQTVYYQNTQPSHLIVDTIANLTQSLSALLFGSCVTVSNLTYTGSSAAIGYFADTTAAIDSSFTHGLMMTTGSVFNAKGPNNSASAGTDNGLPGDADLDALIPGYTTHDASILEFDFTSVSDTVIASKIVFASEEYPEFVGTAFNDVFGFFISGPGISGVKNLALVPNTFDPISVNSVNPDSNATYYVDNTNGTTYQYDGRTKIIELRQAVVPGQSYHFKIAIADAGDGIFDSGVLIKAGSFNGNTALPLAHFTSVDSSLTVHFHNTSSNATVYAWNFGDGSATDISANPTHTYAAPGTYHVLLLASNVCYSDTISAVITVGVNGINNFNTSNVIKVIPTAASGIYNASVQSALNEQVEVRIFNISGQLLYNKSYTNNAGQNNYTVDLSDYAQGLYSVQIIGNKGMYVTKLFR